jgi:hypothetical protein
MSGSAIRKAISKMVNSHKSSFILVLSVNENCSQQDAQNRHESAVGGCFECVRSGD